MSFRRPCRSSRLALFEWFDGAAVTLDIGRQGPQSPAPKAPFRARCDREATHGPSIDRKTRIAIFAPKFRAFMHDNLPKPRFARKMVRQAGGLSKRRTTSWRWGRAHFSPAKGWAARHWPAGMGRSWMEPRSNLSIFLDETQRGNAPEPGSHLDGEGMVGPGDLHFWLQGAENSDSCRAIIDLSDWWCQGFSEARRGDRTLRA